MTQNTINTSKPIDVANGGTGQSTFTDGQLLIGNTSGNTLSKATLTAGSGITINNGNGAIEIVSTSGGGSGLTYAEETGATKTIVVNYEYGANRGGGVAFTLPASATVGDRFAITGIDGLWSVTQGANQYVGFGLSTTTVGAGGSLTATNLGDCITVTCIVTDNGWRVTSSMGNVVIV